MMPVATKLGRVVRDGSTTAATSKLEHFMIIVNDWKPLTVITKSFILDVAEVLDLSVVVTCNEEPHSMNSQDPFIAWSCKVT